MRSNHRSICDKEPVIQAPSAMRFDRARVGVAQGASTSGRPSQVESLARCVQRGSFCSFELLEVLELQSISISFHGKPILQLQGCSCSSCCPHDGTTGRGLASVRRQRDHEHATKCVVVDEAENSRINGHCAKSNQFLICYCTASIAILSV